MSENQTIKVGIKKSELQDEKLNSVDFDYTQFKNGADLLTELKDDGTRWATAFAQFYKNRYNVELNVEFTFIWMANVIEGSTQFRNQKLKENVDEWEVPDDLNSENVKDYINAILGFGS